MGASTVPSPEVEELRALALRITKHLQKNPGDAQARSDLKYVTGQIPVETQPAPEAHPGMKIASGLMEAGLDIPRAAISTFLHPIRAAGQITGIGNAREADRVLKDPDASVAEKADAVLRATPFNIGYATERALLNATGAKSSEPAPLQEQAHSAGNVASLALLGVNRNTPGVQAAGRLIGKVPIVGPLLRAGREVIQRSTPAEPVAPGLPNATHVAAGPLEDIGQALADYKAGRISQTDFNTAMDFAGRQMNGQNLGLAEPVPRPQPPPDPMDVPAFMRRATPENPLAQTAAEAASASAAKAMRAAARAAARAAYNKAVASGQSLEDATIAARWAATHVGLLGH